MSIGRNFTEALGKALRSMEDPDAPFSFAGQPADVDELLRQIRKPATGGSSR